MATKKPVRSAKTDAEAPRKPASPPPHSEFTIKKAAFEIAIVAIGVLLALAVDEFRDSRADSVLVTETKEAVKDEVEQNRIRLVTKLAKVHQAYQTLSVNPAAGPALVERRANMQIELADAAWIMAQQTGALRLMDSRERQALATMYASHEIYNRILAEEMKHWAELAASSPNDRSVTMWKAYARRIASGACISLTRIERFRHSNVPMSRLQEACAAYGPGLPAEVLYREFKLPVPRTRWQPGDDF